MANILATSDPKKMILLKFVSSRGIKWIINYFSRINKCWNIFFFIILIVIIHETEIKQFGNRNGRNRVEIISTLGHKSRIVETDYEGRNELRGSKRITRVETNYEDRNELRGSKRIIKVEMDYVVRALTDWQLVINWRYNG